MLENEIVRLVQMYCPYSKVDIHSRLRSDLCLSQGDIGALSDAISEALGFRLGLEDESVERVIALARGFMELSLCKRLKEV